MSRKARLVGACVILTLASAAASYTYLSLKAERNLERARVKLEREAPSGTDTAPLPPESMGGNVAQLSAPARISASTQIVYKATYECGHEETSTMSAPPEMAGLTREELAREMDAWTITEYSATRVTLWQKRPGMSPACLANMHVGDKDGWVTVFHGDPLRRCMPKSVTRIRVSDLPPGERNDLRSGIPVSGEEDLLRILESLASWRDG